MQNILLEKPSVDQIRQALDGAARAPLLPPLGSDEWRVVTRKPLLAPWKTALRSAAEADVGKPLPELTDELYSLYHRTGERIAFETPYFARRRMLARPCLCALLFPEEPRWINVLQDRFRGILDEESWALPAHVKDASGKDPLTIDLFCAETANLVGEVLTLFGDMPPSLKDRALGRVREQVLRNFLHRRDGFGWSRTGNNWNAVCHQGVIGAALALEEDNNLVAQLLALAIEDLPFFLDGFTADGGCSEGPGYWEYGFGWFCILNEQLERRSGGSLSLFEGDDRIRCIAQFGSRFTLEGGELINFSDCAQHRIRPQLFQYLGERLQDEDNLRQAQVNYALDAQDGPDLQASRSDLLYLTRYFLRAPEEIPNNLQPLLQESFFPDLGVLIAHPRDHDGNRWSVAAKAGNNGEHHNHNDCGSFIVQLNGIMMITEIGSPEYTREFFGPKRYENLAARSLGHSVPLINGQEQAPGADHAAEVYTHGLGSSSVVFKLDLAGCYPDEARCSRALRTLKMERDSGVLSLEDLVDMDEPRELQSALITDAETVVTSRAVELRKNGQFLAVVPDRGTTRIQDVETHTYRDHRGQTVSIRRIVLVPTSLGGRTAIRCRITTRLEDDPDQAENEV